LNAKYQANKKEGNSYFEINKYIPKTQNIIEIP
jgi:hypothetical protein